MKEIFSRVSVRKYKEDKVEQEKITRLLQAAMAAPSAGNEQPWEFIVVEDKTALDRLSKLSPYSGCIKDASAAIIILGNKKRMLFPENWQQDLAASTENILLEAVHLGLGGVWLGVAPVTERMEYVARQFELPDNIDVFAVVPIGYPASQHNQQERYDSSRIHYEKY